MQKEKWDEFWSALGLRANEIGRRDVGVMLDTASVTSHEIEAEKIIAIQQKTSRGFKTFDINPNLLSRSEFFCVYDDFVLSNFVGSQSPVESVFRKYDNEGAPVNNQPVASPYWRTVQIPFEGTFLKVEYLPNRKNDTQSIQFVSGSGIGAGYTDPEAETQNSFDIDYNFSCEPVILVEFENPQGKPLIAKHGDSFKTYFSSCYVSFKQTSARIRITIGYNSEIQSLDDRPQSLALWGGRGLTTNTTQVPKQFCITDKDIQPLTTYQGLNVPTSTGGAPTLFTVLANKGASTIDMGAVPVWITQIECLPFFPSTDAANYVIDLDFYKWNVTTSIGAPSGVTGLERIASGQVNFVQTTSGFSSTKFTWTGEPIRVMLNFGEGIVLQVRTIYVNSASPTAPKIKFSVHGYSFGQIRTTQFDPPASYPYVTTFLTENPWPQDLVLNETSN